MERGGALMTVARDGATERMYGEGRRTGAGGDGLCDKSQQRWDAGNCGSSSILGLIQIASACNGRDIGGVQ